VSVASPKAKILTDTSFCCQLDVLAVNPVVREALLASQGFGFLGPGPIETAYEHALGFIEAAQLIDPAHRADSSASRSTWMDMGSGGGIPGLVCIDSLPDSRWVLLDGQTKRVSFLRSVIESWGCQDRVLTILGRAEQVCYQERAPQVDIVVARGFGAPSITAECATGFLLQDGLLVVSEPPESDGRRWGGLVDSGLGMTFEGIVKARGFGYAVIRQTELAESQFPRSSTALKKRPLF
jgi:16S rRNA (guanine527-N7)-methyltransferase